MASKKKVQTKKKTQRKKKSQVPAPSGEVTPHVPPADSGEGRALNGTFAPGNNLATGRPKGSRNVATRERLALEAALREYMNKPERVLKIQKAIDRLVDLAATGADEKIAVAALKVLTDKVLATAKQEDQQADTKAPVVHVVIDNLTQSPEKDVTPRVIIDQEESENE